MYRLGLIVSNIPIRPSIKDYLTAHSAEERKMRIKALTAKYFVAKTLVLYHTPECQNEITMRDMFVLACLKKYNVLKYLKYCFCFNEKPSEFLFKINGATDDELRYIIEATTPQWVIQSEGKEQIEDSLIQIRDRSQLLEPDMYLGVNDDGFCDRDADDFDAILTCGRSEIEPDALKDLSDE